MQSEREYNYKISEIGNYLAQWKSLEILPKEALQSIAKFVLQEKSKSYQQGVIETCNKILLDLTIADIGTPPKISNVDDRIKIRQCVANLKLHAEQSLAEGK